MPCQLPPVSVPAITTEQPCVFPVSLRNHEHINRKISSGRYGSADDVLRAALALLDEREAALDRELHDVREQVEKATAEAYAGELVSAAEVFEELRQRNADLV